MEGYVRLLSSESTLVVTFATWSWAYQEAAEEAKARAIASKAC